MEVFTQGKLATDGILSEGNGNISRDEVVIASGAGIIEPMTVLGKVTASGKYVPSPHAGATGQQNAVAVNLYRVDATDADAKAIVIARYSEVIGAQLTFEATVDDAAKKAAKATQLASVGIIVR